MQNVSSRRPMAPDCHWLTDGNGLAGERSVVGFVMAQDDMHRSFQIADHIWQETSN